jgi:5-formyltetrahydrofolate cyclo-ligase
VGDHPIRGRSDIELAAVANAKKMVREVVWNQLERQGAVPMPAGAHGRIPNFIGADRAALQLATLQEWRAARTVKANPDKAQVGVRLRALADGKRVYMAVPRLARKRPFVLLDPKELQGHLEAAATHEGATAMGRPVAIAEMERIDLVVCGSVAVNRQGARVGKGGGFSDIEVALLVEAGLLPESTRLVTTVHQLQVLEESLPETDHDFRLDWIVTPGEVIRAEGFRQLPRLLWDHLDEAKIAAIPELAHRARAQSDLEV